MFSLYAKTLTLKTKNFPNIYTRPRLAIVAKIFQSEFYVKVDTLLYSHDNDVGGKNVKNTKVDQTILFTYRKFLYTTLSSLYDFCIHIL